MDTEIWKTVAGYEGLYEVSSFGRVKSLSRFANSKSGQRRVKEIILKYSLRGGYPSVRLSKEGVKKAATIHSLVAVAFLGHTPSGHTFVVDHINGIKIDNRVENIRIVTSRFNVAMGTRNDRDGASSQYPGVSWNKYRNKWHSRILIDGVSRHLGLFVNEIDAANAYQKMYR